MNDAEKMRLDEALVARGLAQSRARARDAILRGAVTVDGAKEMRPGRSVATGAALQIDDPAGGYVSRAALKLVAALDAFGCDPTGVNALDLGASTGGFTQVLLQRSAAHVVAIDVGHGQLHPSLAADPRVTLLEGLNARDLREKHLGGRKVGAIVADLSFISLKLALPPALALAEPGAWGVFLVKPQFEVGREALGKGGIVKDQSLTERTVDDIATWLEGREPSPPRGERAWVRGAEHELKRRDPSPRGGGEPRWRVVGRIASPIAGGSGNREFLIGAQKGLRRA